jgi:hypothetical protein
MTPWALTGWFVHEAQLYLELSISCNRRAKIGEKYKTDSRNGNRSKINPRKVACFSSPKNDRQLTSFHQQSTTHSPSKNHVLHLVFAKTPSKNGGTSLEKNLLRFVGLRVAVQVG